MEAAKGERSKAKRLFTRRNNEFLNLLENSMDSQIVNEKFEILSVAYNNVQSKHDDYVNELESAEIDCEGEDQYIIDICKLFNVSEREKSQFILKLKRNKHFKLRDIAKSNFVSTLKMFKNCIQDKLNENEVAEIRNNLKVEYDNCKARHDEFVLLVDEAQLKTELGWISEVDELYYDTLKKTSEFLSHEKKPKCENTGKDSGSKDVGLKFERLKLPLFNGDIRDYPRFKFDFDKQVMPNMSTSDSAAYVLKSCLGEKPKELVKNIDHDYEKMRTRLDEYYGRTSKYVDVVMYDIKTLKIVQSHEDSTFIKLVDIVEKAYYDLERINMVHEIANTTTVSNIEEKLPKEIRREWSKQVNLDDSHVQDDNKFSKLLKFLLLQKSIIEYETMDIRSYTQHKEGTLLFADVSPKAVDIDNKITDKKHFRCWIHQTNNHDVENCRKFLDMSDNERGSAVRTNFACWSCLKVGHRSSECNLRKQCEKSDCNLFHHKLFHTNNVIRDYSSSVDTNNTGKCLLQLMRISASREPYVAVNVLWDSGSTLSMITMKKAKELNLDGKDVKITVVKVGGQKETINSCCYELNLYDKFGNCIPYKVYGINNITSFVKYYDVKGLVGLFNGVNFEEVAHPYGEIDVLIGFEYAAFHPVIEQSYGNLLLMSNTFGKCLAGSHPQVIESTENMVKRIVYVQHIKNVTIEDFFMSENMGVQVVPHCGACKCGRCPMGNNEHSLKEIRELKLIEDGLTLIDNTWYASYPWLVDPQMLPNNYEVAAQTLKSVEKRLIKNNDMAMIYTEQINDMVSREVACKLSFDEAESYRGPIHYIAHHAIFKPGSLTTPCRIVFNSSANYKGHILNDYWAKGPDLLNNIVGVLIRFRECKYALCGDIRKMYHSVKLCEKDQQTHRFLWRDLQVDKTPDIYIMKAVSFGDRPAGNIAITALRKTADLRKNEMAESVDVIKKNSYMDDILDSVDTIESAQTRIAEIDEILKAGSFHIKHWDVSHDTSSCTCKNDMENIAIKFDSGSQKVLGIQWHRHSDVLCFEVHINFSPKKNNMRVGPDITLENFETSVPVAISKRMILSQVNGIYDPLGLATPITVTAKCMMRKFCTIECKELTWDQPIPDKLRDEWVIYFKQLFDMEKITFKRALKPDGATGEPVLIIFSDASENAFGSCAYVRWICEDGNFRTSLVMAKSRLAPLKRISIVRLELSGAVMAKRMKDFIVKETRLKFAKVYFIVDSEIVRAMIQKDSYGFNTFVGVRIGEIQSSTCPSEWYWVEGELNIADWATRGKKPEDIDIGSIWQQGPTFLQLPESNWPLKQDCKLVNLPEQIKERFVLHIEETDSLVNRIEINKFSSYKKLIHVTARILMMYMKLPNIAFRNATLILKQEYIYKAEMFWVKEIQTLLMPLFKRGQFDRIGAYMSTDGIIMVGKRMHMLSNNDYNLQNVSLLPGSHTFSYLYALKVHNESHLGISATASKIRSRFWITKLLCILKGIRNKCVVCKKLYKITEQQVMGLLPRERLIPAPVWHTTSLDYFGPFIIRGEVSKRSRGKAFGLIFTCTFSRAVHVDLAGDYSTDGFINTLRRFLAVRGCPAKLMSDCGSQLLAADKELKSIIDKIDKKKLNEFGSNMGFDWQFSSPDAPWQNGTAEALIKSVKKAIKCAIGSQVLSFPELMTVFYEVGNLVNERPIGRHPTDPTEGAYLCPNMLLLGRCSGKIPNGNFDCMQNSKKRYLFVQKVIQSFWDKWTRDFFPCLTVQNKWHVERRNLMVGDIVLIQDNNAIRGCWKLGKVSQTYMGKDGHVRNVDVQYKNILPNEPIDIYKGKGYTTVKRPIQRLVLLIPVDEK